MSFEARLHAANRAIKGGQTIGQVCAKLAKPLDGALGPSPIVARLRRELERGANIRARTCRFSSSSGVSGHRVSMLITMSTASARKLPAASLKARRTTNGRSPGCSWGSFYE